MRIFLSICLLALAGGASAADPRSLVVAGGCFWCVEADFDKVEGVVSTTSGYTGGTLANPGYKDVVRGGTGHLEAVEIAFDPALVSEARLLDIFFRTIDPTDAGGQFCDRGESYTTAIFVSGEDQRQTAEAAKTEAAAALGQTIVTPIRDAGAFYPAEDYHQDFYKKNPVRYQSYRKGCGRDGRVRALWGKDAFVAGAS